MGWGLFNLVEGLIDHHLLQLHHVREESSHQGAWDVAFLVWGAAMLVGGWSLSRAGQRTSTDAGTDSAAGGRRSRGGSDLE
jgi:uncharacterized membrane protein